VHTVGSIPAAVAGGSDRGDEIWMDSFGYFWISYGYMWISIGYHSWIFNWIISGYSQDILMDILWISKDMFGISYLDIDWISIGYILDI
jgi:hypothetical protein